MAVSKDTVTYAPRVLHFSAFHLSVCAAYFVMLFKSLNTYRNWLQKFMICLLMRRINSSQTWGIVTFRTKDDHNNAHLVNEISYAKEKVFSILLIENMYIPIYIYIYIYIYVCIILKN